LLAYGGNDSGMLARQARVVELLRMARARRAKQRGRPANVRKPLGAATPWLRVQTYADNSPSRKSCGREIISLL
jgi:hypothetical protein